MPTTAPMSLFPETLTSRKPIPSMTPPFNLLVNPAPAILEIVWPFPRRLPVIVPSRDQFPPVERSMSARNS